MCVTNGSGVVIARCPLPSRSSSTAIWVSFVLRASCVRRTTAPCISSAPIVQRCPMRAHRVLVLVLLAAFGGSKQENTKPEPEAVVAPPPHKETEEDRAKKRHDAAVAIVPDGSTCLPTALKADNAPRLELAGEGADAVLCAVDGDPSRLLGPIGCWTIDLKNVDAKTNAVGLVYKDASPLPGHNVDVLLDGKCARGYCLPDDAKLDGNVAHMS